ncbi:MAG TPA: TerC family protein [Gemmatimonadaceae bacterium]|nr:TerC family protein [Gemmatimonadaceae bacterium]
MLFFWLGFLAFVFLLLAIDLGVFHREAHVVRVKEAFAWTAVWVTVALLFSVFIYFSYENHWLGIGGRVDAIDGMVNDGRLALVKFLTGYVIEWSLSVDNVFVIAMIFSSLGVPAIYQHRVLFWGILGALAMRGVMIGVGAQLVARYHWILYLFGVFLIFTAIRMAFSSDAEEGDPGQGFVLRMTRKYFRVTKDYHGQHFTVRDPVTSKLMLTPLAVALVLVETTDLIFAVDSIPAIFAITADPFLVATSNVFAILGLRSLYFALAGAIDKFSYLKYSLALILALVGAKMLAADWLKEQFGTNFNFYLLGMVALILLGGVAASLIRARNLPPKEEGVAEGRPGTVEDPAK